MSLQKIITSSIPIGQSTTSAITLNELNVSGIITGSALDSTSVTFLASVDGVTFYPLYDIDGEVTLTSTGGSVARAYSLNPSTFFPWNFIKVREGTNASAVNQTVNNCTIIINAKEI